MTGRFTRQLRLLLVRHGEAVANQQGAFLGRRDDKLTIEGKAQAKAIARWLTDESVDRLISSPLIRARDTAHAISQTTGVPVDIDPRLIEQDFGAWEGLTFSQVQATYPETFERWLTPHSTRAPYQGESLHQVSQRIRPLYESLCTSEQPQTVILVGHAGCFQTLLCLALGVELRNVWPFRPPVGSLTELHLWMDVATLIRMGSLPPG